MAISDKKKSQTAINVTGQSAVKVRALVDDMIAMRTKYIAQSVDPTGTALEGNEAAMNQAITDLQTEMNKGIWTQLIASIKPSHRNEAL